MTIEALRTPEERFAMLPGLPYSPSYIEDLPGYEGLRFAYLDEGPKDAEVTFLCLHGEPTWSYLYRKMLPVFTSAGHRVIAPDLFGFGRSDKPVDDATYTFDFHRNSLLRFVERLDLTNIVLVCQDWGGILGLTLPVDMQPRFSRMLIMNTALPVGEPVSPGFAAWKGFAANAPDIPVAGLVATDAKGDFNLMDALAYDAPFPDVRYKAGVRRFPALVQVAPGMDGIDHSLRSRAYFTEKWTGESFMALGERDAVLGAAVMEELRSVIRGCPPMLVVPEAGHFVQEYGEPVALAALEHFGIA